MQVEYRIVAGWPAYRVGDDGSIWSCWRKGPGAKPLGPWKEMAPTLDREGYRRVDLRHIDGRRATYKVCSLVCTAFHGERPDGLECRHLDGNPANDAKGNLAWGTPLENHADKRLHGTIASGERHGRSKLTDAQITELHSLKGKIGSRAAGERFGVTQHYVNNLWSGRRKRGGVV